MRTPPSWLNRTLCHFVVVILLAYPVAADELPSHDDGTSTTASTDHTGSKPPAIGDTTKSENKYVRVLRDESKEADATALQTSVCNFHSADGMQQIDLIGAVHIGEIEYYQELNRRFRNYDVVLYELVAPKGTRIPKGGVEPDSAVGYVQSGMTQMLGLAYQLQEIDYTAANFVHADMTPEEFSASMKKRDESFSKMFFRALGQSLVQQTQTKHRGQEARMLAALVDDDRELALRCLLAEQFSELDGATLVFGGPDGSTLITERNKKALRVLKAQLADGKSNVAIFYGAGHLNDMAKRLMKEFALQEGNREWLTAWDLQSAKP